MNFIRAVLAIAALALLSLIASAGAAAGSSALERTNQPSVFQVPSVCCAGCPTPAGCCCAPHNKRPVTVKITKIATVKKTKTYLVTRTSTYTARKNAALFLKPRDAPQDAPILDDTAASDIGISELNLSKIDISERDIESAGVSEEIDANTSPVDQSVARHELFARNLCPVCPAGKPTSPASFGKNNGRVNVVYCCPGRKTVTQTVTKVKQTTVKKTSTVVKTTTVLPNKLSVIVFVDYANDGNFQNGDALKPGVPVDLVYASAGVAAQKRDGPGCIVVSTATTDSKGSITFEFGMVPSGVLLCVTQHQSCAPCLASTQADANGLVQTSNKPLEVPLPIASTSQAATASATRTASATKSTTSASQTATQYTSSLSRTSSSATATQTTTATITATPGAVLFDTPGTYEWTAPEYVNEVHVACVGGGSGGGWSGTLPTPGRRRHFEEDGAENMHHLIDRAPAQYFKGTGGSGGGLGWQNNIPVIPGQNYTVVVGAGGANGSWNLANWRPSLNGTDGGDSYFISTTTVAGFGGKTAIGGGFYPPGQGGNGGAAFVVPITYTPPSRRLAARAPVSYASSGGGGAGGYAGDGGFGGAKGGANASDGQGGAGGGGYGPQGGSGAFLTYSGSGGGVSLGGLGTSGWAGANATLSYGGGGSNGCNGLSYNAGPGARAPTGAGGGANHLGGNGACRIVWGNGLSWPSNVPSLSGCAD